MMAERETGHLEVVAWDPGVSKQRKLNQGKKKITSYYIVYGA